MSLQNDGGANAIDGNGALVEDDEAVGNGGADAPPAQRNGSAEAAKCREADQNEQSVTNVLEEVSGGLADGTEPIGAHRAHGGKNERYER